MNKKTKLNYQYPLNSDTFNKNDFKDIKLSLEQNKYTMGDKVKLFEKNFSKWLGVKNSIMVNSGSSANLLMVASLLYRSDKSKIKLKKGDEVIVPALSWSTTVWPIIQLGLKPIFADISIDSLAIDLFSAKKIITKKTKAIFLIHVLGQACDMQKYINFCKKENLILIEDCCESFGAFYNNRTVGSYGHSGSFSHYYSHHLTTIEGGSIITNDDSLANDLRSLRAHGWIRDRNDKRFFEKKYNYLDHRFLFLLPGFNVRPTEIQGILGLNQLKRMKLFLNNRDFFVSEIYNIIKDGPKWLKIIGESFLKKKINSYSNRSHSWMSIPLLITESKYSANRISSIFEKYSIETRPIISGNITKHPAFENIKYNSNVNLKNANHIHKFGLMIGCHPSTINKPFNSFKLAINELKKL